ncbi:MAG: MarR family transcriptional regulator [Alicyclobacillus sp.]|nr:MarR family transcriptional regulator [Alicyclobacillus sp.]
MAHSERDATPASPSQLARQVADLLPALAVKLMHFVKDFPVPDVTLAQAFLLHHLREHGPCTASTIGELLGITSGPVTSLTKRLVARGLVDRRPDAKDGRVVWFALTADGARLSEQLAAHSASRWELLIRQLGAERTEETLRLMTDTLRILDSLDPPATRDPAPTTGRAPRTGRAPTPRR